MPELMEDHRQQHLAQPPPINWQPPPMAFSGYQMPLMPPQMLIPQPVPYYQSPVMDYSGNPYETMVGYQVPFYAQQPQPQPQRQQPQQQAPVEFQNCYGSYGPAVAAAFQSSYPPFATACYGNGPPQWSAQLPAAAPPWQVNPGGQPDIHSESSTGRSPKRVQKFGAQGGAGTGAGAGRGWKRNRDGSFNARRPGGWQRNGSFQGVANSRPLLRCETCERNFVGRNQMEAHMRTHVKCNVNGCSFEGIGKAVSEHRQQVHFKKPASNSANVSKASEEETRKWREARRRNYPTTANLERKLKAMQDSLERGELVDEDALMRQESLKEILSKQAELGCPVAEIPPYYLSQRYTERNSGRPSKVARTSEHISPGVRNHRRKVCAFFQRGHCKKGRRCQFLHELAPSSIAKASNSENARREATSSQPENVQMERQPSLLSKLLSAEIKRDKSHLLQCFRFFVNNKFLADPSAPLELFEWTQDDDGKIEAKVPSLTSVEDEEDEDDDALEDEDEDEEQQEQELDVEDNKNHDQQEQNQ